MAKVDILGDKQGQRLDDEVAKPEIFSQSRRQRIQSVLQVFISLLFILGLWEGLVWALDVSHLIMPRPSAIFASMVQMFEAGTIYRHLGLTVYEVLLGFVIATVVGISVGTVIAVSPTLHRLVYPYIVAFQSVPKVAVAPLMVIWFGFGIESKIAMTVVIAFFPILVNTIAGLRSVDQDQIELMRSLVASRWQIFRFVRFPNALPYIFAGLEIGIVLSVIGAIVGEFVGATGGLGYMLTFANARLDTAAVFALLIVLGAIGIILNTTITWIRRKVVFWAESETDRFAGA